VHKNDGESPVFNYRLKIPCPLGMCRLDTDLLRTKLRRKTHTCSESMSGYMRLIYSTGSRRTYARNPIESKTNASKPTNSTIVLIVVNPGCAKSKSAWIPLVQSVSPESPAPFDRSLRGWVRAGARRGFPSLASDYPRKKRVRQSVGSMI